MSVPETSLHVVRFALAHNNPAGNTAEGQARRFDQALAALAADTL